MILVKLDVRSELDITWCQIEFETTSLGIFDKLHFDGGSSLDVEVAI